METPEITYNFEVEGFHTYYVGENAVLVHNACSIDYSNFSTGRTTPSNLYEKLAMEQAKSSPSSGKEILSKLSDPRLDNCVKMSQNISTSHGNIEIHYVFDKINNVFFDFKFID